VITPGAVRAATSDDLPAMADALAQAFHDDPMMQWLFGDQAPRPMRYSRPFFLHEGARHLRHHEVFTIDGVPGAAYWDPPGQWKTGWLDVLRTAPLMLRGMGTRSLNALRGLGRMEAMHARQPAEHHYLAVLGTRPDRQGTGVGSALMAPVLERCDAEGIGAYLESSKEANIPFYRRHGFEVVGEVEFPSGPKLWPMWRDPQAPSADR
jgi:GNAT superfamily N-acetyltransferase